MCYYVEQKATIKDVAKRYKAVIDYEDSWLVSDFINGFDYPNLPIITNTKPDIITTTYSWGLLPSWAKEEDFRKNTLNARIETIDEKASFKNITQNRCLIIATGYYEWHWNDSKGKSKDKYIIRSQENEIFSFAGLYTNWKNPQTGEEKNTYTIVTTEANNTMQYIHNHKKRMPIILNESDEKEYLNTKNRLQDFAYPRYDSKIIGFPI